MQREAKELWWGFLCFVCPAGEGAARWEFLRIGHGALPPRRLEGSMAVELRVLIQRVCNVAAHSSRRVKQTGSWRFMNSKQLSQFELRIYLLEAKGSALSYSGSAEQFCDRREATVKCG